MSASLEVCCPDCGEKTTALMLATSVEPRRTVSGRITYLDVRADGLAPHQCPDSKGGFLGLKP